MLGLPFAFAAPAVLAALIGLGVLYFLLRVTPPRPREQRFPPLRLMLGLADPNSTPARTPWPLLALRLLIAGAVVIAMAGPIWNAVAVIGGNKGPLLILLDDGWPAAPAWRQRTALASEAARAASAAGRLVALLAVSDAGAAVTPLDLDGFEHALSARSPTPYAPARSAALAPVQAFLAAYPKADVLWIADGLELGGAGAFASDLKAAAAGHEVEVALDSSTPVAISGVDSDAGALSATLTRADASARGDGAVRALDSAGRVVGEAPYHFGADATAKAAFELPVELRNEISRLVVADQATAGGVWLLDERWRRRRVAILSDASSDVAEPLLSPVYYIKRALQPFAEVREARPGARDPIGEALEEKPSVLVLADMSLAPGEARDRVEKFVEGGGVLVRFAGTRLAAGDDDLTPTALRRGGRTLGGALSWETPKHIAEFEPSSPFLGLAAPQEITVSRQVLAEPEPGLETKTWARLADGTPLVTAAARGKGLVVLFHVTADTTWSNLPISGLFVEMLRRTVALSGSAPREASASHASTVRLSPYRTLDGRGALGSPPPTAQPIAETFAGPGEALHPPGFYGPPDGLLAVNALANGQRLARADLADLPLRPQGLEVTPPRALKPILLLFALVGFLLDGLATLWLPRSPLARRRARAGAALLALGALIFAGPGLDRARAQNTAPGARDEEAALETHLAYVVSGDSDVDETSRLGLQKLSLILDQRTSAAIAEPVALDPARDELAFYPLIYWPIVAGRPQPSSAAVARLTAYMRNGGTVVFDTRDALDQRPDGPPTPEQLWLRKLLAGVDVPELEPTPHDHVVTKTFYLLDRFVGRTDVGQTWIEALPPLDPNDHAQRPARAGDSVSPIIIASNDLAAAWAVDERGAPLHPLIPGGARQREMALRGGVNLVMYALTGNYKADQVHAKDLLERLAH